MGLERASWLLARGVGCRGFCCDLCVCVLRRGLFQLSAVVLTALRAPSRLTFGGQGWAWGESWLCGCCFPAQVHALSGCLKSLSFVPAAGDSLPGGAGVGLPAFDCGQFLLQSRNGSGLHGAPNIS